MYTFGKIKHWPEWIDVLTRLNHVLLALNSSINIVIYTAKVKPHHILPSADIAQYGYYFLFMFKIL